MKLKILDNKINVKFTDPTDWDQGAMGRCNVLTSTLMVNNTMEPDIQRQTLIHELVHWIAIVGSVELNEEEVDTMAIGFNSFLANNKKIVRDLW